MVTMLGWLRRPAERASRRKRTRTSPAMAAGSSACSVFSATSRSIIGSTARYTTPIAPRPSSPRMRYRPSVFSAKVRPFLRCGAYPLADLFSQQGERAQRTGRGDRGGGRQVARAELGERGDAEQPEAGQDLLLEDLERAHQPRHARRGEPEAGQAPQAHDPGT